jgi:hypothetical protein
VIRTEKIGEGQFGEVFKGILDESSTGGVPGYLVACKSVVDGSGEGANDLLQEALVMAQVGSHPNLVSLIGVVTSGLPLLLVVSYCERGSLLSVLRDRAEAGDPLSIVTKLRFAVHIASGMAHLASLHFIHRDLAARNVLVDAEFSGRVADFGLSRGMVVNLNGDEGGGGQYYRSQKGVFPVRWTAPEAMSDLKFTTESDVWSFGVVMAEIFQDGRIPYAGVETEGVIRLVCQGDRIERPPGCPADVYSIMRACWCAVPGSRPTYATLIPGLQTEIEVELVLEQANAAPAPSSSRGLHPIPQTPSTRSRALSGAGYSGYSSANAQEVAHASGGGGGAAAPPHNQQGEGASSALYRPMYAEKPQLAARAPPPARTGITMATLIQGKNEYAEQPQAAYGTVASEMQPMQHAPTNGAGYLDMDTNDPSNASHEVPTNTGAAGHEGGGREREGNGRGVGSGGEAPRQGKGIKRDMRKPSVYEGFGAADEETRL